MFTGQYVFRKEVGGVLLTPQSVETATSDKKMTGSMLIFQAENIEKIRVIIESDVYYTSGVVGAILYHPVADSDCASLSGIQRSSSSVLSCRLCPFLNLSGIHVVSTRKCYQFFAEHHKILPAHRPYLELSSPPGAAGPKPLLPPSTY